MKKIVLFLVALVAFFSCEETTDFNNTFLQVVVDEEFLRTENPTVTLNPDGTITLKGSSDFRTLTLNVLSSIPGTYKFGTNNTNIAYYKYENPEEDILLEYSTIEGVENPDLETDLGELIIYPFQHPKASKTTGTISGEFHFRGRILNTDDSLNDPTVFFHQGHFYNLKIGN